MKKNILFIFVSLLVLFSCSEKLEQIPTGELPITEAMTTVSDLQIAVNGVYSTMVNSNSYCGDFGLYADGKGGDVDYKSSNNHFAPIINLQTDKNSGESNYFYKINYVGIARVNEILAALDQIEDRNGNDEYGDLVGQLHALKALFHFDALRTFCPMPNLVADKNAAKSGIVIVREKPEANTKFTRSTMQESYDYVKAEFAEALKTIKGKKVTGEMNEWTVKALRARMHLYLGEYSEALKDAVDVIKNSGYSLLTRDAWLGSWAIEGAAETLLEIRTSDLDNAQRNSIGYYTHPDGYPEVAASDNFMTFYNTLSDNDIRKSSVIQQQSAEGEFQAYYSQKYRGRNGVTAPLYVNNPKLIRLSEIYYIAAEAVLKGGTAAGAESAVHYYNTVRANRIAPYTPATSVTTDDILDERRIELFCENSRMFDLVRLKSEFSHPRFSAPIQVTDSRLYVEFPQRELDINPNF